MAQTDSTEAEWPLAVCVQWSSLVPLLRWSCLSSEPRLGVEEGRGEEGRGEGGGGRGGEEICTCDVS